MTRSLDPARARAEERVQRFLDAALELMTTSDTRDFTVQQVVERSGQSLRSFYQYFAGKHELLLALFEESVSSTAEHLYQVTNRIDDPLERLHAFVSEYYRLCTPNNKGEIDSRERDPTAIAEFAQQLLTEHPREAARAYEPLVTLLEQLLTDAADAGELRSGLDHRRLTGVLLQAIMFNAFAATISQSTLHDSGGESLWEVIRHGIATRSS